VDDIIEQKKKLQTTTFHLFGIADSFKDVDITEGISFILLLLFLLLLLLTISPCAVSVYESAGEEMSFAPLYQCLYIYQSLDILDKFALYYKKNRKLQCDLALNHATTGAQDQPFSATYQQYFQVPLQKEEEEEVIMRTHRHCVGYHRILHCREHSGPDGACPRLSEPCMSLSLSVSLPSFCSCCPGVIIVSSM